MTETGGEARIRAATVGDVKRLDGKITLADYDPDWPGRYAVEAERIRSILGARVVRLEHVGSTAVPGLAAKPVIDLALVVQDSSAEATYVSDLESSGYLLRIREQDWYEHRLLKGPATDINLHVFSVGCVEVDRMVSLRDRLRTDAAARGLYERTKRELAQRTWGFVQDYADAKSTVIESILSGRPSRS